MTKRTASIVFVITCILPTFLNAENVRGPLVGNVLLDSTSVPQAVHVGLEDLLELSLKDHARFIKGIEINLTIPPAARRYENLLGLYVYKSVTPVPASSTSLYEATRAGFIVLPATSKAYVNIPLQPNAVPSSPETITLSHAIPVDDFPIIVTVLPVAKGLPSSVSEARFPVKVSPILEDKGLLKLDVTEDGKPPEFPFTLTIDDQTVPQNKNEYVLSGGIHHFTITSDHYKEVNKTFGVDKGRTTAIEVSLERLVPKIVFEAPDNAEIFLDGQKLEGVPSKPMTVTEGEHTVIMKVGNYSLTKKFSVERGKLYKLSLFLDILVQEN